MGFSGGGSNILKPHTHDSTILQDGGNLNFQNVTQSNMSAGSITQSDGNHLQELLIGTPAQIVRVNAGATALEYYTPPDVGEDLINKGDLHGCLGGSAQTAVPVSVTDGDVLQADSAAAAGVSYTNSPVWYNAPAMELLASYTAVGTGSSGTTITFSSVNLETDYAKLLVVANIYTAQAVGGFGEFYMYVNSAGGTWSDAYGYSFDSSPALTALNVGAPTRHVISVPTMTATNSNFHSETSISLAKTATTTDTIVMKSDCTSNQNESQHWENSVDRGTVSLTNIVYQCNLSAWDAGSNISVYGVKYN
jgi:hypothetical protein